MMETPINDSKNQKIYNCMEHSGKLLIVITSKKKSKGILKYLQTNKMKKTTTHKSLGCHKKTVDEDFKNYLK